MLENEIQEAFRDLAEEIKAEVRRRMESEVGINQRVGRNTLVNSDLYKSVDTTVEDNTITFLIADHFEYVVKGWKRTGHGDGTFQDYLIAIKDWIRRKNIKWGDYTENQMMWILAKRMFSVKHPYTIQPRPFINWDKDGDPSKILPFLDKMIDNWFDKVFDLITKDLDNYFNSH